MSGQRPVIISQGRRLAWGKGATTPKTQPSARATPIVSSIKGPGKRQVMNKINSDFSSAQLPFHRHPAPESTSLLACKAAPDVGHRAPPQKFLQRNTSWPKMVSFRPRARQRSAKAHTLQTCARAHRLPKRLPKYLFHSPHTHKVLGFFLGNCFCNS